MVASMMLDMVIIEYEITLVAARRSKMEKVEHSETSCSYMNFYF